MKKFVNPITFLCLSYFILASINLTLLPIFNDESIYLDWADRSVNLPGKLYYSIYDGKTPFQLWMIGISQHLFQDPLFAGRIISVIFGTLGLLGIYTLAAKFFSKKTAIFSSIFYMVCPIIFFYNRQALMESGVLATVIWASYFFMNYSKKRDTKNAILIGIVLGIGFFIKTNAALFLLAIFLIESYKSIKQKKLEYTKKFGVVLISFITTILLLIINPVFWQTLSMNSRYSYTFLELLHFPIINWAKNIYINLSIFFIFITPIIFVMSIFGIYLMRKKNKTFLFMLVIPILLQTILVKAPQQRYIVSFTPLLLICAGYFVSKLYVKNKKLALLIFISAIIVPLILVLKLLSFPKEYFMATKPFSKSTEMVYMNGSLSGYGVDKLLEYINKKGNEKMLITYAENAGNPESAINIYLKYRRNIQAGYLESSYLQPGLDNYDCIKDKNGRPIYFVSRSNYMAGLERFMKLEEKIPVPNSSEFIGFFEMKNDCSLEKTLVVDPVLTP